MIDSPFSQPDLRDDFTESGDPLVGVARGNGVFYFQEFYEGEARDMGKILNYRTVDTFLFGDVRDCVRIKEYSPLDPGAVEHKYYCGNLGLVEENSGGKTVFETLINVSPTP
jgi:hypothetical protein